MCHFQNGAAIKNWLKNVHLASISVSKIYYAAGQFLKKGYL